MQAVSNLENSIVSTITRFENELQVDSTKFSRNYYNKIREILKYIPLKIRIVSYNILFNLKDQKLSLEYQWVKRLPRLVMVIREMSPDIMGTQEVYNNQIKDLQYQLSEEYDSYGAPAQDGEANLIFFRKKRFQCRQTCTFNMVYEEQKFRKGENKSLVMVHLFDKSTQLELVVYNSHLSYLYPDEREYQARFIAKKIKEKSKNYPVIFMADTNGFPIQLDHNFPNFSGNEVQDILTKNTILKNTRTNAVLGHLGSHGTFTNKEGDPLVAPFQGQGSPGVNLDEIFVSFPLEPVIHAVQPATVNKLYPSDHQPVIADVVVIPPSGFSNTP